MTVKGILLAERCLSPFSGGRKQNMKKAEYMKKIIINSWLLVSICFFSSLAAAGSSGDNKERDIIVDRAIGGMEEGSRILSPEGYKGKSAVPAVPGHTLAPGTDIRGAMSPHEQGKTSPDQGTEGAGGGTAPLSGPGDSDIGPGGGTSGGTGSEGGGGGADTGGPTTDSGKTLLDIDADVNLTEGTVDAGVGIDTSAGIEDSTILDADLSATDGSSTGNVEADIAEQDIIAGEDILSETVEHTISAESTLDTEIDTGGSGIGSEAEVGVEADVEGAGSGDDVASDPPDGLSTGF